MLCFDDDPIIKRTVYRRLCKEPGIQLADLKMKLHHDCIRVGLLFTVDSMLVDGQSVICRSVFDLPRMFDHSHLVNEIDEVCEQAKEARRTIGWTDAIKIPEMQAKGTGLRGRWKWLAAG